MKLSKRKYIKIKGPLDSTHRCVWSSNIYFQQICWLCDNLTTWLLLFSEPWFWNDYLRVKIIQVSFCLKQRQFEIYVLITNHFNQYPSKYFPIVPLFLKDTLIFLHFRFSYTSQALVIYPIIWKCLLSAAVFREICIYISFPSSRIYTYAIHVKSHICVSLSTSNTSSLFQHSSPTLPSFSFCWLSSLRKCIQSKHTNDKQNKHAGNPSIVYQLTFVLFSLYIQDDERFCLHILSAVPSPTQPIMPPSHQKVSLQTHLTDSFNQPKGDVWCCPSWLRGSMETLGLHSLRRPPPWIRALASPSFYPMVDAAMNGIPTRSPALYSVLLLRSSLILR